MKKDTYDPVNDWERDAFFGNEEENDKMLNVSDTCQMVVSPGTKYVATLNKNGEIEVEMWYQGVMLGTAKHVDNIFVLKK